MYLCPDRFQPQYRSLKHDAGKNQQNRRGFCQPRFQAARDRGDFSLSCGFSSWGFPFRNASYPCSNAVMINPPGNRKGLPALCSGGTRKAADTPSRKYMGCLHRRQADRAVGRPRRLRSLVSPHTPIITMITRQIRLTTRSYRVGAFTAPPPHATYR